MPRWYCIVENEQEAVVLGLNISRIVNTDIYIYIYIYIYILIFILTLPAGCFCGFNIYIYISLSLATSGNANVENDALQFHGLNHYRVVSCVHLLGNNREIL